MPEPHSTQDDFRFVLIPSTLKEFWDYPRNKTLRQLQFLVASNRLPQMSIFVGPPGSGKNAAAYAVAAAASCEEPNPVDHAACGRCRACRHIRLGRDSWERYGFFEIECNTQRDPNAAINLLNEATDLLNRNDRRGYAGTGDADRKAVVFLDEAQRLPLAIKADLLTRVQRWPRAHLILATTNIRKLQVEPDREPKDDPLISRGSIFRFDYPTVEEATQGLLKSAASAGLKLELDAASWVATRNCGKPRECLGDLYLLASLGSPVSLRAAQDLLADVDEASPADGRAEPDTGTDEDLF